MDSNRWNTIEPILDQALELPKDERKAFIKQECNEKPQLFDEIIKLLKSIERSEDEHFLDRATKENNELIQKLTSESRTHKFIGKRIGVFELTEQIGSGGMATVFKAKRVDGQFERQVAIKLIRNDLHLEEILQRFKLEKQILANLTHSNIARLYDAGLTDDGIPYLIMELISGVPIDQYCNQNKLSITERLELFGDVCQAVEYAHTNLTVHRDLKASNIFVTEDGQVKVLDFGIAKLLDTELTHKKLVETRPDEHIWTPQYASPEQIEGKIITTASDVYSLGVLLHKLLTGTYPYDFEGKSISQIYNQITNEKPNTLTKTLKNYSPSTIQKISKKRSTSAKAFKKVANGDLKTIVYKAIQKRTEDRYASVDKLAEDVSNYLHNRPVSAQKQTFFYHLKYFARRYKKGFTTAVLVVAVITGLSVYYTHRLSKQKQVAVYQAKKATTVSSMLETILRKSSPYGRYTEKISLDKLLVVGKQQIKNKLSGQPLLKAEMLNLLGQIYTNLGQYTDAKPLFKQSLKIQENTKKPDPILRASTLNLLGYLLFRVGLFEASEHRFTKAEVIFQRTKGKNNSLLADLYNSKAMLYGEMGKKKKAIALFERALQLTPEKERMFKTIVLGNLGVLYQNLGQFDKSRHLLSKSLHIRQKLLTHPTPKLANSYNNLAFTYQRSGNLQMADSLHRIALNMRKKILPPGHPHIASSLVRYGLLKIKQGKFVEAEQMLKRGYQILKNVLPDNHWQVLSAKGGLALARGLQGNLERSIPILKNIYNQYKMHFSASDWRTKTAHHALQTLLLAKQRKSL